MLLLLEVPSNTTRTNMLNSDLLLVLLSDLNLCNYIISYCINIGREIKRVLLILIYNNNTSPPNVIFELIKFFIESFEYQIKKLVFYLSSSIFVNYFFCLVIIIIIIHVIIDLVYKSCN